MRSGNRIAIVGAGIAGLVCAKVLTEDGFTVEVFDRAPDIGGVWSETRRYPGLRAQSTKNTYHFSDHPMPADYPRVLDGARMQEYLSSYVRAFGLTERLRLRTEVVAADPVDGGWLLEIRDVDGVHRTSCDHLIIANGVSSEPAVPDFAGTAEFARAGGQLGHSTQFLDVEAVRDRSVVVVGYGASAADLATEISTVAVETTMVARRLLWKMPRRLAGGLDAERILLTRTGAAHFGHPEPDRIERLLHGPARSFRDSNLDLIEALTAQRSGAADLGLVPDRRFEQDRDAAFGLVSEGFVDQVTGGRLAVLGGTEVTALGGGPAGPFAELSDGRRIRAEIVVCATGFQQRVRFLTPYVQRQLTDDDGNFRLYRQILPLEVPHLTFAGYHTSLLSAVSAEIGAHWTSALLTGNLALPPLETMSERIDARLRWLDQHTGGRHARGTVTPDAIRDIDELLADMGVRLPWSARAAQWLRPVRPSDYRVVTRRKRGRGLHATAPAAADPAARPGTAPLPTAAVPEPVGTAATPPPGAPPATPQPPAVPPAAESPTVRIPEAAAASAVRTTTLPPVDPTARTRPVPEVRSPAAPIPEPSRFVPAHPVPTVTPGPAPAGHAASPLPPPSPGAPPRPATGAPRPPTAPSRPTPVQQAAMAAERRAVAERRAAGIVARSNSPTVQIDMRAARIGDMVAPPPAGVAVNTAGVRPGAGDPVRPATEPSGADRSEGPDGGAPHASGQSIASGAASVDASARTVQIAHPVSAAATGSGGQAPDADDSSTASAEVVAGGADSTQHRHEPSTEEVGAPGAGGADSPEPATDTPSSVDAEEPAVPAGGEVSGHESSAAESVSSVESAREAPEPDQGAAGAEPTVSPAPNAAVSDICAEPAAADRVNGADTEQSAETEPVLGETDAHHVGPRDAEPSAPPADGSVPAETTASTDTTAPSDSADETTSAEPASGNGAQAPGPAPGSGPRT